MRVLHTFLTTNRYDGIASAILVLIGLLTFILVFDARGGFYGEPGRDGSPGPVATATRIIQERTRQVGGTSVTTVVPRARKTRPAAPSAPPKSQAPSVKPPNEAPLPPPRPQPTRTVRPQPTRPPVVPTPRPTKPTDPVPTSTIPSAPETRHTAPDTGQISS